MPELSQTEGLIVAAAVVGVGVVGVVVALALTSPPGGLSVSVSPSSVPSTGTFVVTVSGATPNTALDLKFTNASGAYQTMTGAITTDAKGNGSLQFAASVIYPGSQSLTVTDPSTDKTATTTFIITS